MTVLTTLRAALAVAVLAAPVLRAQQAAPVKPVAPATFGWFAELVSFDAKTSTMTVRARIEPHVARYVSTFAPGDRIVLTWTQFGGNADAVMYVVGEKAMTAQSGYVVRGRFVAADANAKTVTIAVPVPATVAASLTAAKPGTPIRVAAPLTQPGPEAILTSVALNKTAPVRPAPVVKAAPTDNVRQIAGDWALDSSLMGNPVTLRCNITQGGKKLGGMCQGPGPLANLTLNGSVNEDDVVFAFEVSQGGATIALRHAGKLSGDGNAIEGTLDLMGNVSKFKATKQ